MNITHPFGISVFGSAIMRVEPDLASISFTVSHVEKLPQDAFQKTRTSAQKLQPVLARIKAGDVGVSQLMLSPATEYNPSSGKHQFVGYNASIDFNLLLRDLGQLESMLVDLVGAGVNKINQVKYQTTRLKELRIQVRQQAVTAAREKAEMYCASAGVRLGRVLHVEDVNPNMLRGEEGYSAAQPPADDEEPKAFNPASILVGGAVMMAFEIA